MWIVGIQPILEFKNSFETKKSVFPKNQKVIFFWDTLYR